MQKPRALLNTGGVLFLPLFRGKAETKPELLRMNTTVQLYVWSLPVFNQWRRPVLPEQTEYGTLWMSFYEEWDGMGIHGSTC
jgi:hypothetical protein